MIGSSHEELKQIPFKTKEALHKFSKLLKTDGQLAVAYEAHVKTVGDTTNPTRFINDKLALLLSNELLTEVTWGNISSEEAVLRVICKYLLNDIYYLLHLSCLISIIKRSSVNPRKPF